MRRVTRPREVYRAYAEGEDPDLSVASEAPPSRHEPGADWSEPVYGKAVTGSHARRSRWALTALACLAGLAAGFGAVTVIERLLDAPARDGSQTALVAGSLGGPSTGRIVGSTAVRPSYDAGGDHHAARAPGLRELGNARVRRRLRGALPGLGSLGEPAVTAEPGLNTWLSRAPVAAVGLTVGETAADNAGELEAEFGFEH